MCVIVRLKCDGTRAETRFRLSLKRTSPFKSARASVQSTAGSRGVRISGSNARYTTFRGVWEYWLPIPFASFPFTSPPMCHRVPSGFKRTLPTLRMSLYITFIIVFWLMFWEMLYTAYSFPCRLFIFRWETTYFRKQTRYMYYVILLRK